ncbi:MAG: hypothetical protein KAU84_04510 [Thermoplasmatales archaeon]|nr:hypothetical protein [Thermoplasmatales archaeon]
MYKKCFAKKGLALVTIALFIGMSAIPIAGDTETEKYADAEHTSFGLLNNDGLCVPYFMGITGKNFWYIGDVEIWFIYKEDIVETIWYSITEDLGQPVWKEYLDVPFRFGEDGLWIFQYKWEDIWGNETLGDRIPFKIDKTPPTITLNKQIQNLRKKIIFTANANDVHSKIERVEFWIDGKLEANITSGEYEYIFTWEGKKPEVYDVKAIAYNMAGHSNEDNSSTTSLSYPNTHTLINKILQKIQTINLFLFQLLKSIIYVPFN